MQITQVSPLGVRGLTPLDTTMSNKGLDLAEGVCVHHLTLTKPGANGKDIGNMAMRVRADSCWLEGGTTAPPAAHRSVYRRVVH